MAIDLMIVPKGAEYSAVSRGLKTWRRFGNNPPPILPIPIGRRSVEQLSHCSLIKQSERAPIWQDQTILLLGLGGSLSPSYNNGDIVLLKSVEFCSKHAFKSVIENLDKQSNSEDAIEPSLMPGLYQTLYQKVSTTSCPPRIATANGVTTDHVITTAREKQCLGHAYKAGVVDMESTHVLKFLQDKGARVGIVRVISDNSTSNIPDLNVAIDADGNMNMQTMIGQLLRQPIAATRLVRGSLKGLKHLEFIAACCASLDV